MFGKHSVEMMNIGTVDGEDAGVYETFVGTFVVDFAFVGLCLLLA